MLATKPAKSKTVTPEPSKAEPSKTEPAKAQPAPPDTAKISGSDKIIKGLQEYSQRKSLPARIVSELFDFREKKAESGPDPELISYEYANHDYKIVRRIQIKTLDAFGYSVTDSTRRPKNILEKGGNSLHIKTRRGRGRNKLLFKAGEPLEPQAIIESERLLRQTEAILDARIRVIEETTTADSVDILIITRDVFSIGAGFGYNTAATQGVIVLRDVNFLGYGHQFRNRINFGIDNVPQPWTYDGSYLIENISGTYADGLITYYNDYFREQRGLNLYRYFYATTTKNAGGLSINWFKDRIFAKDSTQNLHFNVKDAWFAHSFKLKSYNLGFENPGRFITGARIINTNYTKIPNSGYLNSTLYLGSAAYSYRKYYKDKYLFGFGRTEDIPAGNLFALTMGYEYSTFRTRQYSGFKTSFGKYGIRFGYLYAGAEFGSFLHKGKWEQGVLTADVLYFTRLYNINGWLIRNFLWNRSTFGLNRYPGELVNINNYDGLRGFSSSSLLGQNKFTINLESVVFTPVSFVGFHLAGVVFADVGWLSPTDKISPFREKPYEAIGVGLRFRNEYLSFGTIQILAAFYPKIPAGETFQKYRFYESSRPFYDFQDFFYAQPSTAPYR